MTTSRLCLSLYNLILHTMTSFPNSSICANSFDGELTKKSTPRFHATASGDNFTQTHGYSNHYIEPGGSVNHSPLQRNTINWIWYGCGAAVRNTHRICYRSSRKRCCMHAVDQRKYVQRMRVDIRWMLMLSMTDSP